MKIFLAGLAIGLLCGCRPQPVKPASAQSPTNYPPLTVRRAKFTRDQAGSERPSRTNRLEWAVSIAEFPEKAIERYGLAELFAEVPEKNDLILEETGRSPLMQLARADSNIVLSLRASVFAGAASVEAATNLLEYFKQTPGTDVLTFRPAYTVGSDKAQVHVGNNIPVLTGASSNSSPSTPFTTNLAFGHTITMQLLGSTSNGILVRTAARSEQFDGYVRDEKQPGNQYQVGGAPIFGLSVLGTRTELRTNEVLLLGSPTHISVRKIVEKVPVLSDIPGLSRIFTKTQMETNYLRRVVFIWPIPQ
jgi:hypothetical protein